MIYLLTYEEHSFDIDGRVKTHIKGYTTEKSEAEDFVKQNEKSPRYGIYKYQEVKQALELQKA